MDLKEISEIQDVLEDFESSLLDVKEKLIYSENLGKLYVDIAKMNAIKLKYELDKLIENE